MGHRYEMRGQRLGSRSYWRSAYGFNRVNNVSNDSVYGKFGMAMKGEGMNCRVVEVMKCSIPQVAWSLAESEKK